MNLKWDDRAFSQLVPLVLTVVIVFALVFIGAFVNGTISKELKDTITADSPNATGATLWTSGIQNSTRQRMNNSSVNFDTSLDIVQVCIIITILAAAIGAIFLFTKYGR